ncbi:MAG: hypothetical protein M1514_02580 [Patescibacteria group bacterium]|nr:hypothetical protein [Patescibacteria group bacterium]
MSIIKKIIYLGIFFLLFLQSKNAFAANLLNNSGFEELLISWEASSGLEISTNVTVSSYTKNSGGSSCEIKHNKTGSYGAQQLIRGIIGGSKYRGNGYAFFNSDKGKNVRIRIAWYSSDNGSGSQIKTTVDSNIVIDKLPKWQFMDTGIIEAPLEAKSAEFRILLASLGEAEALTYFDDLSFEETFLPSPTPTPTNLPTHTPIPTVTLIPSSTITLSPTAKPSPTSLPSQTPTPQATYKINEVKNEGGEVLSNIQIYVDGNYIHHYAPEIISFCNGCYCDADHLVSCNFGDHTFRLEKTDYSPWSEVKNITSGSSFEVNPILSQITSIPTMTPLLTVTPTTTPTMRLSPTLTIRLTPTLEPTLVFGDEKVSSEEGKILGELTKEITPSVKEAKPENKSSPGPFLFPFVFIGGGVFLILLAVFYSFKSRSRLT